MTTPLQTAAQHLIDRWDSPLWKDQPHTGVYIAELRKALAYEQAQAVEPVSAKHRTTGWVSPVDRYAVPVLFNPYTGEPRDVRDVQSDPQGVLIVPPGKVEMLAAKTTVESVTDCMMNLVDRLGHEASDVDARAWEHLLVYAPKQAQAVEPATGERAELIAALRECHGKRLVISPSMFSKAADMLEADAQEIERTLKMYEKAHQGRADFRQAFREARKAQQVAAPDGNWLWCKLMDFCKKRGYAPAAFDDLFAIVGEARAQQVAVPVAVLDAIIRAGFMLVKAQSGYSLLPTSRIEAQGAKP